jgi:hypothetical protein
MPLASGMMRGTLAGNNDVDSPSTRPDKRNANARFADINRELARLFPGCWVCGSAETELTRDTVFGTAFAHHSSETGRAQQVVFYETALAIGALRLACRRCNSMRGLFDRVGMGWVRKLDRGAAIFVPLHGCDGKPVQPALGMPLEQQLPPLNMDALEEKHRHAPLTSFERASLAQVLRVFSVGVTSACACTGSVVWVCASNAMRHLVTACPEHVPPNVRKLGCIHWNERVEKARYMRESRARQRAGE